MFIFEMEIGNRKFAQDDKIVQDSANKDNRK